MATYYVLTPPDSKTPHKDTLFIRDGFSWLAFWFPLAWLLVKRLWLFAGVAVILYLVAVLCAETWGLDGLPLAYGFVFSLWAGLEGGYVRSWWLRRQGWSAVATLSANDLEEAEIIYFAGETSSHASAPPLPASARQASRPDTVALGLIGSYGGK